MERRAWKGPLEIEFNQIKLGDSFSEILGFLTDPYYWVLQRASLRKAIP